MKIKKILIVFFLFIFMVSNFGTNTMFLKAVSQGEGIIIEDGEEIKDNNPVKKVDETKKNSTEKAPIDNNVKKVEVKDAATSKSDSKPSETSLDAAEGNIEKKIEKKDPTKLVPYKGCNSGYGILQKVLDIQSENISKNEEEIKKVLGRKNPLVERHDTLKGKVDINDDEKKQVIELEQQITQLDKQINDLKINSSNIQTQNLSSECVLMDINKVKYDEHSDELPASQSYLVINDDSQAIVASKNANKKYSARDFVKYYLLGMINHDLLSNNLTLDYKIQVDSRIYKIQEQDNLENIGLRINKLYSLEDMMKLLKYRNYDDVMYALISNLYGNEKIGLKKLNNFLKNVVKLKDTNLTNIFGLSEDSVTTANDIITYKNFIINKDYRLVNNVSYETSIESLSKVNKINKEGSIMDPNSNWYYSDVKEYFFSSYLNSNASGLFTIQKLNQNYSVVIMNVGSKDQLYEAATKLMKNSINYKYSNILIDRNDSAKIDKIFKQLNINRLLNVKHGVTLKNQIRANLEKTFAVNLPEVYLDFLDIEIKLDNNINAPKTKNDIIGKIIFKDNKYKKIKTFDNKHEIAINLHTSDNVEKENLIMLFFKGVNTFFNKWVNAISRINN